VEYAIYPVYKGFDAIMIRLISIESTGVITLL
jgi:hypothetical protein